MTTMKKEIRKLARSVSKKLKDNGWEISHSVLLHLIAESAGETNWHVVSSKKPQAGSPALRREDLAYIHELIAAEELLDSQSRHLNEAAPRNILRRLAKVAPVETGINQRMRSSLMSCAEMLQECLRTSADNDQADTIDQLLIEVQAALNAESTAEPSNRMILAAQQVVDRWEKGDLADAVRELEESLKESLSSRASNPASSTLLAAAQDLLDAFGGPSPDWLRPEAIALENAVLVEKQAQPLDHWGEDHGFPIDDWKYEVSNDDTRLGYWQWANAQKEQEQNDRKEDAASDEEELAVTDDSEMPNDPADPQCECGNCAAVWKRSNLNEAKDLDDRLDFPIGHPECVEPDGECPDCGALCYEIETTGSTGRYVIYSQWEEGYWSNRDGWTDVGAADQFTSQEKQVFDLPSIGVTDAQWLPLERAKLSLLTAAREVVADYDAAGCEHCGVVSQSKIDALRCAFEAWGPGPSSEAALVAAVNLVLNNYDTTGCDSCGVIPELHYQQLSAAVMSLRK